ncbi:gas vesicle protein GvpJ [Nonomuraea sp. NPDC003754]
MTVQPAGGGGVTSRPSGTSLADVVDTILDKGLVIDAYVSVSLIGIEILSIDARIVVASVDTYLRFAEATDRLDLTKSRKPGLPEVVQSVTGGGGPQEAAEQIQAEQVQAEQVPSEDDERPSLEAAGKRLEDLVGDRDEEREPARSRGRKREEG